MCLDPSFLTPSSPACVDLAELQKELAVSELADPDPKPTTTSARCTLPCSGQELEARRRGRLRRRHAPAGAPARSPPAHAHQTPSVRRPSFLSSMEVSPLCSFFDNFLNPHTLSGTFSFLIPSAAARDSNHVPFQSLHDHASQSREPPSGVSLSRESREKATTSRGISALPESFARGGKLAH